MGRSRNGPLIPIDEMSLILISLHEPHGAQLHVKDSCYSETVQVCNRTPYDNGQLATRGNEDRSGIARQNA